MDAEHRPSLRTARLLLRPLTPDDAAHFTRLLGPDPEAVRQMAEIPDPCTEPAARAWIEKRVGPGAYVFAIERRADSEFVGIVGFGGPAEMLELGYWIGQPYRRQGFATEAVCRLIAHAVSNGIERLHADTFPDNPISSRVLSRAGFLPTGIIVRDFPERGGRRELVRHLFTAPEF
jgi:RimJ/RimL family protein N-acetyltransferase